MEKMISVNAKSLSDLREYYNLSIDEVCERTKIKIDKLLEFEHGEDYPSYSQLEKLADYYNRPVFYFFSKSVPMFTDVKVAFRKIESRYGVETDSKLTMELIEKALNYKANLEELYLDEDTQTFSSIVSTYSNSNELANGLREILDLTLEKQSSFSRSEDLLEYLRTKLYDNGVYVFKDSFKCDAISGLCFFDDKYPIVLLNNKTSFNRQLFTLFHEIYHLYLHETDIDYTEMAEESECNKFASDFLIPETDLSYQLKNINNFEDISIIDNLAERYNVSRDAIMYRLIKMNLLDWNFYNTNKVGFFRDTIKSSGGNFYFTKMSYLGTPYLNKVFNSYYSGKLSKTQVGMYTGLKSVHVSKLASKMIGGAF